MKHYLQIVVVFCMLAIAEVTFSKTPPSSDIKPLSQQLKNDLISAGIWKKDCPVTLDDLRVLTVSYFDLSGKEHRDGKIILHKSAINSARDLFTDLYKKHFPFSKIGTLLEYHNNLVQAENENVTYGYVCKVDAKNNYLPEAYGTAITINPTLNPEVSMVKSGADNYIAVEPTTGMFSVNRELKLRGMTETVEAILNKYHFFPHSLPADQWGHKRYVFNEKITHTKSFQNYFLKKTVISKPVFTSEPLSAALKEKIKAKKLWNESCPVLLERLSLLTISYYDFAGNVKTGNLVVFDGIAPFILNVFKELFQHKFPLEEITWSGENPAEQTMAFNCRNIVGENASSIHSYGLALDVNVHHNPYIGEYQIINNRVRGTLIPFTATSFNYIDRGAKRPGMNEGIVSIMAKNGLIDWGGNWQDRIDYMHFQVPKNIAQNLIYLDVNSAKEFIKLVIAYPEAARKMSGDKRWNYLYQLYPKSYIQTLKKYFSNLRTEKEILVINRIYLNLINK